MSLLSALLSRLEHLDKCDLFPFIAAVESQ